MGKANEKVVRLPSNCTPNRIIIRDRQHQTDIFYGNKGSMDVHKGHTVLVNGRIVAARSRLTPRE